jgi:hypothetical protein
MKGKARVNNLIDNDLMARIPRHSAIVFVEFEPVLGKVLFIVAIPRIGNV